MTLSPGEAVDPADLVRSHEAFWGHWYYSLELAPGIYTAGAGHQNVALTRELLSRVDVEGMEGESRPARCLDIGTREAMVPILLERRGASVVAYDRDLWRRSLELVGQALDTKFELLGDFKLEELPRRLQGANNTPPYDLVVLSGVLYHMVDPMMGLAVARGLVRNGGLLIVETLASFDEQLCMHFNEAGRMGPNSFWVPSVPCLDYLLRFLRLEALDVVRLGPWQKEGCPAHGRVAVACRAVAAPPDEPDDPRIAGDQYDDERNFAEFLDWNAVRSDLPPVAYSASGRRLIRRQSGTLDLLATACANDAHEVTAEQIRLDLGAQH